MFLLWSDKINYSNIDGIWWHAGMIFCDIGWEESATNSFAFWPGFRMLTMMVVPANVATLVVTKSLELRIPFCWILCFQSFQRKMWVGWEMCLLLLVIDRKHILLKASLRIKRICVMSIYVFMYCIWRILRWLWNVWLWWFGWSRGVAACNVL